MELTSLSGVTERLIAAKVKQRRTERGSGPEPVALAAATTAVAPRASVQQQPRPIAEHGDRRQCYACGHIGHMRRDCPTNFYRRQRNDGYRGAVPGERRAWTPHHGGQGRQFEGRRLGLVYQDQPPEP